MQGTEGALALGPAVEGLARSGALPRVAQYLARSFVGIHELRPRPAALFATQQRWLLCHAALAHYFRAAREGRPSISRQEFWKLAVTHGIASRNTAIAFFEEVVKYAMAAKTAARDEVEPTPEILTLVGQWYALHLQAFDLIDAGDRAARFTAAPMAILPLAQPIVADHLLSDPLVRVPGPHYAIFTWADAGGLIMDRLVAGADLDAPLDGGRYATDVIAITHLAESVHLSRAHTSGKLAAAEAIGGLGWTEKRGRSPLWISQAFVDEYARAQALKLVILDHALTQALAGST